MKLKLRPLFKDIFLTFISEAVILIGFFIIYGLISRRFGEKGVGEYSLVRRVIAFIQPFLVLGFGVGLPRYIAISKERIERISYVKSAFLIVSVLMLFFLLLTSLFRNLFAQIFFGSSAYTNLVVPFSLLFAGVIAHTLVYLYFQGQLFSKIFNLLQVINLSVAPIIILVFFKNIILSQIMSIIGIIMLVIAFIFSFPIIKDLSLTIKKIQFVSSLKELLHYSLPRAPADFMLTGLLSLGPIFAAHFASIQEVGYLSVSQSVLFGMVGIVSPLGIVLLPKISSLVGQRKEETIKANLHLFVAAIMQCSIFVCIQLLIFTDTVIKYWLGYESFTATSVMRIIFVCTVFYVFYVAMRNILDAVKVKPINTINLSLSFGVFLLLSGILLFPLRLFSPIISLSISFTSGLICLGILTFFSIRRIYPENLNKDLHPFWTAIVLNLPLAGIAFLSKPFVAAKLSYLVVFEVFYGIIYLFILWVLKTEWLRQIPLKIRA